MDSKSSSAPTAAASPAEHAPAVSAAILLLQSLALVVISVLVVAFSQRQHAFALLADPSSESSHVLDAILFVQAQTLAVL